MFKWLLQCFIQRNNHVCQKCGSSDTIEGNYIRGYNNYCEQVYDDRGYYCYTCCKVDWKVPLKEHIKTLPDWCTPYKSKG